MARDTSVASFTAVFIWKGWQMGNGLESQLRACARRLRVSRIPAVAGAAILIAALAPRAALATPPLASSAGHHGLPARTSSGKPAPVGVASRKQPGLIPLSAPSPQARAELAAMAAASASADRTGRPVTSGPE